MSIVIVDYGSGNLRSAAKAFERAVREADRNDPVIVSADAEDIRKADRVVLPGVGAFADCKAGLAGLPGMLEALEETVIRNARPFLGICVGMQLMARIGREFEDCDGLNWIAGEVVALQPQPATLKIPHMGWNELSIKAEDHPVLNGLSNGSHAYFVHSFHLQADHPDEVLVQVDYGGPVTAMVGRDNMVGTQFHPEKSQATGLKLIQNFLNWKP